MNIGECMPLLLAILYALVTIHSIHHRRKDRDAK